MMDRIEQAAPSLSPAERRVAKWVLESPRRASESTVAEVASQSGTSEPTVIRFCRRFGLSGFRELKIRLVESLSQHVNYVHRAVRIEDSAMAGADKVIESSIQSLIDLRRQLKAMPIDEAVAILKGARQIAFAGIGASGYVARDASHKFFRLGTPCFALTDSPSIRQFAAVADSKDVILAISHTGKLTDLRDPGDATVIAITTPGSDLARAASLVFPCTLYEDTSVYTPMSSRLVYLALLDAIHVALALSRGRAAVDKLRRSKEALRDN